MAQRTAVKFELVQLALDGDELVVTGVWTGVRGMRFIRPALLVDGRRILATLEHKPWTPADDARWQVAFPWEGELAVTDSLALAVAPKVIVPLGATTPVAPAIAEPDPAPDSARAQQPAPVSAAARQAAAASAPAPAAAAGEAAMASAATRSDGAFETNGASASPLPVVPVEDRTDELARSLAAAERDLDRALAQLADATESREAEVRARAQVQIERDDALRAREAEVRARAQVQIERDDALQAREADVRARARMELERDEALEAREIAETGLAEATAERQEAVARRDEVLVAFKALQRERQAERAQADRKLRGKAEDKDEDEDEGDTDEPLGVRTVPAVRGVMAELQYPRRESRLGFTRFDLWVVRVLALAAAGCFFVLLYSILRVVI